MSSATPHVEAAALLDVVGGDEVAAIERLEDFYPTELDAFANHVQRLGELIDQVRRGKSAR